MAVPVPASAHGASITAGSGARGRWRVGLVAALLALASVALTPVPASAQSSDAAIDRVLARVAEARSAASLPALRPMKDMQDVAGPWAAHMASQGALAHNPNLTSQVCCWSGIGENVGVANIVNGDVIAAADKLHEDWMASQTHRDNIQNGSFEHVGIGVEINGAGTKLYGVQVFRAWDGSGTPDGGFKEARSGQPAAPRDGFDAQGQRLTRYERPVIDGNPASTERVADADPLDSAIAISKARFYPEGATHVVLARSDVFADSLAGTALTGDGPLLFTNRDTMSPRSAAELERVLTKGKVVYLLGGPNALSPEVEAAVAGAGYDVRRLNGPSRVETALAIGTEVLRLYPGTTALMARAYGEGSAGWADSVTGGAYAASSNTPVVITQTEALSPAVRDWLQANGITRTIVLGGPGAVSEDTRQAAPGSERVSGPNRDVTAAEIARQLWGAVDGAGGRFTVINGHDGRAWAYGMAAAGLAADLHAPMLVVNFPVVAEDTLSLAGHCTNPGVEVVIVGPLDSVSDERRADLDSVDGRAC